MKPHNFDLSSKFEASFHTLANDFYLNNLYATKVIRYNSSSIEDLEFQRKDIDVTILKQDKPIHISEKFRKVDYGDIYLEIYSKYPSTKGWMEHSKADFIAYFIPQKVILINKISINEFYQSRLMPSISLQVIADFADKNREKNATQSILLNTEGYSYKAFLIAAYNEIKNAKWCTIGITVPLELLDFFNIKYKIYNTSNCV